MPSQFGRPAQRAGALWYSSPLMSPSGTPAWLGHTARVAGALGLLGAIAITSPATASPLEDPTAGGAVFTGPTAAHASSIFLNPAALGFARRGLHLHIGGSLRLDSIGVDRRTVDPATGALGDGPSVSTTTWSPGGTMAVYGSVLQDQAVLAAAIHTTTFDRFPSGKDALGYHVLGGYVYQGLFSVAGCFRPADWFLFGLGVSIGYAGLELDLARDTALEAGGGSERGITSDCGGAPCGFENPEARETYHLSTTTGGLGGLFAKENLAVSLGVAVKVKNDWWVTLSVASPPGAIPARDYALVLEGDAEIESAPRDGGEVHRGRAEITYRMPYLVWLGARGTILPGYDLVTSARWQNLSRHDLFDVRLYGGDLGRRRRARVVPALPRHARRLPGDRRPRGPGGRAHPPGRTAARRDRRHHGRNCLAAADRRARPRRRRRRRAPPDPARRPPARLRHLLVPRGRPPTTARSIRWRGSPASTPPTRSTAATRRGSAAPSRPRRGATAGSATPPASRCAGTRCR